MARSRNGLTSETGRGGDEAVHADSRYDADAPGTRDQKRLAVALKATGAGVFELGMAAGASGCYTERFAAILGYTPAELPPLDVFTAWFFDQIHPDDREGAESACREVASGEQSACDVEFRIRRREGEWRDVTCRAEAADRDASGRAATLVGALLDRTEQKHMEEQLRRAQRMEAVGRLAGGVAHDFNNLLTVISNFGEFVAEQLPPDSAVHADMSEVLNAARRAEQLTRQLLTFSRRQPSDLRNVNVNELVGDTDRMLRRLLGEDVEYSTHLAPELWDVRIDPGSLEQVLVNLAINGRDAMNDGGRLKIETRNAVVDETSNGADTAGVPPGRYVVVSVTDDGTGMDAETQERIFEPFFTTKGPDNGTGLGLATCYGIVKQSGGFIVVRSAPGRGTTFAVYLPRASGETAAVDETPEPAGAEQAILVVEDETVVRNLIVRVLSPFGYTILQAANGSEALSIAESTQAHISLVLTDVVMPEMSGPELVEQLKSSLPELHVLYMSGYTRGALQLADEAALVKKPFSPQALADAVREALGFRD